jgi:hypothetical protein
MEDVPGSTKHMIDEAETARQMDAGFAVFRDKRNGDVFWSTYDPTKSKEENAGPYEILLVGSAATCKNYCRRNTSTAPDFRPPAPYPIELDKAIEYMKKGERGALLKEQENTVRSLNDIRRAGAGYVTEKELKHIFSILRTCLPCVEDTIKTMTRYISERIWTYDGAFPDVEEAIETLMAIQEELSTLKD